jgi:LL-diaminopimelate aminotransferase
MPECGAPFLREAIAEYYACRGVKLDTDEVFVSSGASDELGDILDLFDRSSSAMVMEPAYPAYVDASIIAGRDILHVPAGKECGFVPAPDDSISADLLYICSPNNPTGAVFTRDLLKQWVDYANQTGSVILFDAAYEAFISEADIPRSIYEIEGAKTCAIEISSLSKTAGFTGLRLGFTVIPADLKADGVRLWPLWARRHGTKYNGAPYIVQRAGEAVYTEEGRAQIKDQIAYYMDNARIIYEGLQSAGYEVSGGVNAPYIWLRTPDNMTSWEFFDSLLSKANVVGTPGSGFGPAGEHYFRLTAFGTKENTIRAIERIRERM